MKLYSIFTFFLLVFCGNIYAEEINISKLRSKQNDSYLDDIYRHVYPKELHYFQERDLVTSGHECLHAVNSRIRREYVGKAGFYLKNDKAFIFSPVPVKLKEVAALVEQKDKNHLYQTYLIDAQKDWNDEALYVLDELSAYVAGYQVGREYNLTARYQDSQKSGYALLTFSKIVLQLAKERNYSEIEELTKFVELQESLLKD